MVIISRIRLYIGIVSFKCVVGSERRRLYGCHSHYRLNALTVHVTPPGQGPSPCLLFGSKFMPSVGPTPCLLFGSKSMPAVWFQVDVSCVPESLLGVWDQVHVCFAGPIQVHACCSTVGVCTCRLDIRLFAEVHRT